MAEAALGDEVVDAALALLVAAVPVLNRRVLDLRIGARRQLHHRRMQLQARTAQKSGDRAKHHSSGNRLQGLRHVMQLGYSAWVKLIENTLS